MNIEKSPMCIEKSAVYIEKRNRETQGMKCVKCVIDLKVDPNPYIHLT